MPDQDQNKLIALYNHLVAIGVDCTLWEKPTIRRIYLNTPANIKAYFQIEPHKQKPSSMVCDVPFYLEAQPTKEVLQKHIYAAHDEAKQEAVKYVTAALNSVTANLSSKEE